MQFQYSIRTGMSCSAHAFMSCRPPESERHQSHIAGVERHSQRAKPPHRRRLSLDNVPACSLCATCMGLRYRFVFHITGNSMANACIQKHNLYCYTLRFVDQSSFRDLDHCAIASVINICSVGFVKHITTSNSALPVIPRPVMHAVYGMYECMYLYVYASGV